MTPLKYLPPPWWKQLVFRFILIPLGTLFNWHYWFISYATTETYISPGLRRKFGLPPYPEVEPLDEATNESRMWDQDSVEICRKVIALARAYNIKAKFLFEARTTLMNAC